MFYPKDFKARVKKAYPNWEELHQRLESGDVFVGRYLDDSSSTSLSLDTILNATSLEELQEKARLAQEKVELYREWSKLYKEQRPNG